eukprot:m.239917 g.239917  ORF g.239917 m.239917 type:complete len:347 (-) comp14232_c0_seq1:1658-2698(-)
MGGSYSQPKQRAVKWYNDFLETLPRMDGKTVVITGTTSGTGFVGASTMGKLGARVIVLNRPSERAKLSLEKLKESCKSGEGEGNDHGDDGENRFIHVDCDLQSFDSVHKAVEGVKSLCVDSGIDVLCCNAGIMATDDVATVDGYDVQMQTNHLSHFLLTRELMPELEKAAEVKGEARVVTHSSESRRRPNTPLDATYYGKNGGNLGGNGSSMFFSGAKWERYHQTKLANIVFALALDERLRAKGSKVKALSVHPGLASTDLQVKASEGGAMKLAGLFMLASQSVEDGTMPLLKACCAEGVESGEFYGPKSLAGPVLKLDPEPICTNQDDWNTLWEASEAATGEFSV